MLTAIITMVIVLGLIGWAHAILTGNLWGFRDPSGAFIWPALGQAVGVSVAAGAICLFAPMLSGAAIWLSVLMYLAAIAGYVNLFLWWRRGGSLFVEMIPFLLLALMFTMVTGAAAPVVASLVPVVFLAMLIQVSPWLLFWAIVGYLIAGTLMYHYRNGGDRKFFVGTIVAAVIIGIVFLATLGRGVGFSWNEFWGGLFSRSETIGETDDLGDAPSLPPAEETSADMTVEQIRAMWRNPHDVVIRNNYDKSGNLLSGDELAQARLDDWDFGPGVLEEAVTLALEQGKFSLADMANKTERELYELVGPDLLLTVLVDRWAYDPLSGTAAMIYKDALFHTRDYGGEFIAEYEDEIDKYARVMNDALDAHWRDQPLYYEKLNRFLNFLYTANRVTIEYRSGGITDQMYANGPLTLDELNKYLPELIVYKSYDHEGYFITFEWLVKGTTKQTMSLRLDCGGQPCDVGELLGVTPAANPNGSKPAPTSKPKPSNPGNGQGGDPNNGGGGQGGDPGQEPPPEQTPPPEDPPMTNPKDPSKGTNVPVNDVQGPGPDTNNGVGSQFSSVQTPDGSVFLPDYGAYEEAMKPIEQNPARPAGTPNTPTYNPTDEGKPAPDAVDNNGDNGYGWGGADDPTPVQPPAEVDVPGYDPGSEKVEWGGPPL